MIRAAADIIRAAVKDGGNEGDFIGHAGGDDFVAVSTPSRIEIISDHLIDTFDKEIQKYYDEDDLENGYIYVVNRRGEMVQYPILSMSVAIVSTEFGNFDVCHKLNDTGKEILKRKLRPMPGSNTFKDRRRS